MLQDMAILTGGQVISEELGLKLEKVEIEQLGGAKRVVVDKDNTTIVGGRRQERMSKRVATNCGGKSRKPLPITIAKNSKNVWQNWPAALRSFTSARHRKRK